MGHIQPDSCRYIIHIIQVVSYLLSFHSDDLWWEFQQECLQTSSALASRLPRVQGDGWYSVMQITQGTHSQSVMLSICKTLFICRIILPSFAKRLTQWVFTLINLAPVRSYPWSSLENAHGWLRAQSGRSGQGQGGQRRKRCVHGHSETKKRTHKGHKVWPQKVHHPSCLTKITSLEQFFYPSICMRAHILLILMTHTFQVCESASS